MIGVVYIHRLAVFRFMKSSVSHGRTVKSAFLVILMIIMTQVGYLDLINSQRTGNDSFNDDSSVMETGGSSSSSSFAYTNNNIAVGWFHTCAILDNGDVKCWGDNTYGQLGDGGNAHTNAPSISAIDLGTGRTAVAVTSDFAHTCALLDNGELKCWGLGGALGDGGTANTNAPSSTPIDLGTGRTAVAVSAGREHTCAILDNGDVKCWGGDNQGQLGNGGNSLPIRTPPSTAIDLGAGRTAVALSAGYQHTCAILDNGDLKCWGKNTKGQLGNGGNGIDTNAPSITAIDLGPGRTAVAVSAGDAHTCAILDNGELKCWGSRQSRTVG